MKIIAIALLMAGCATIGTRSTTNPSPTSKSVLEKKIRDLEEQLNYVFYEQTNRYCFNFKDICRLQAHDSCEGRGRLAREACNKKSQDICFKKHEECIINNYYRWQALKKLKGYK